MFTGLCQNIKSVPLERKSEALKLSKQNVPDNRTFLMWPLSWWIWISRHLFLTQYVYDSAFERGGSFSYAVVKYLRIRSYQPPALLVGKTAKLHCACNLLIKCNRRVYFRPEGKFRVLKGSCFNWLVLLLTAILLMETPVKLSSRHVNKGKSDN